MCHLVCAEYEQSRILQKLFLRELKPHIGWIEEVSFVPSVCNSQIFQRFNFENSMRENLQSRLFQQRIWFQNRFCSQDLLFEILQIPSSLQKPALYKVSSEMLNRFLVLTLVLCNVKLVLIDVELASNLDSITNNFLTKYLSCLQNAFVVFAPTSIEARVFSEVLKI